MPLQFLMDFLKRSFGTKSVSFDFDGFSDGKPVYQKSDGRSGSASSIPNRKNKDPYQLLDLVEVSPGIQFPRRYQDRWSEVEAAARDFISIKAVPTPANSLQPLSSQLLAIPFLPVGVPYPLDEQGKPLIPLAQINFSDCPPLPGFPSSGLLQFYIANDDAYGLNFDDIRSQSGFRVLYFREEELVDPQPLGDFLKEVLPPVEGSDQEEGETWADRVQSPVFEPHQLFFTLNREYPSLLDFEGDKFWVDFTANYASFSLELKETFLDFLFERFSSNGHKISGYAAFTQYDPRKGQPEIQSYRLLFQLDSDDQIMFGDSGVANFFIAPEDLEKSDFTKVVYNWDCC
jgi:uncharacterized protein YwqG